uniref:helix-turn-helix transcriptional regulator n=1 Tax=Citrobacter freundii TaxID=546 RepID=UPI002097D0E8|nr:hypothetical protein [Citrobacter freundii]URZ94008.1 hypothetical protein [Citrobacter freundii]
MAERHSIDLPQGTQDLSTSFLNFHRQSSGSWYIKNEKGQFIDCSDDFLSLLANQFPQMSLPAHSKSIMNYLYGDLLKDVIKHEEAVLKGSNTIVLFIVTLIENTKVPLILTINGFNSFVFVKVDTLFFLGVERLIISQVLFDKSGGGDFEASFSRFEGVNPFSSLNIHEWNVAWLMTTGMSKSEISNFLKISDTLVKRRMGKIYRVLKLKNHRNFMHASINFQWRRFISPGVLNEPYITTLKIFRHGSPIRELVREKKL